ncbi:MAG: alpha/beta hydrolase [Pseudomonadota bacterium]
MSSEIHGPTSHIYFSQRLRLHYVDWGNPDAPPMLLIHGGRDHCRNWDWFAQRYRDRYHIIAPDLRGHGDSEWLVGGNYDHIDYIYDIAQLLHQTQMTPLTIVSHSLGGSIALNYAGLFPQNIDHLVAIEGLGPPPQMIEERFNQPLHKRVTNWIDDMRQVAGRTPRRYPTVEEAFERMQAENPHLTAEQARHLTIHGVNRNEDGTYSWKFDNYIRAFPPLGIPFDEQAKLHGRIDAPVLLVRGAESWASDPEDDGRIARFKNARLATIENAGHWVHHDQLDEFCAHVDTFLA